MHVEYTPAQIALRREFRSFLAGLMSPGEREQLSDNREGGELYRTVIRRMGEAGRARAEREYDWDRLVAKHYPPILEVLVR